MHGINEAEESLYFIPKARQHVANTLDIDLRAVKVEWHHVVGEWCIYIDHRWYGYICPTTLEF